MTDELLTHPHLEGLIRKWRKKSENAKREADWSRESASFHDERDMLSRSETYNACAEELEAALAALPGGGVDDIEELLRSLMAMARRINNESADHLNESAAMLTTLQTALSPRRGLAMFRLSPTPTPHEADQ